jgi:hypothetical protein
MNRTTAWLKDFLLQAVSVIVIMTLILFGSFYFVQIKALFAADTTELSQRITDGSLDVAVVDASGDIVTSPVVNFSTLSFTFSPATTTATLGTVAEKMRVSNPTGTAAWSLTLAATSGATATWSDGGTNNFDYNDANFSEDGADTDSVGGRLAVDPAAGSITGVNGCATTNVSLGSASAFNEGVTNSITLITANATASKYCRWDLTGVAHSQSIPAAQAGATYTLDMTLTAS